MQTKMLARGQLASAMIALVILQFLSPELLSSLRAPDLIQIKGIS